MRWPGQLSIDGYVLRSGSCFTPHTLLTNPEEVPSSNSTLRMRKLRHGVFPSAGKWTEIS